MADGGAHQNSAHPIEDSGSPMHIDVVNWVSAAGDNMNLFAHRCCKLGELEVEFLSGSLL
jgi:hypothetical protein